MAPLKSSKEGEGSTGEFFTFSQSQSLSRAKGTLEPAQCAQRTESQGLPARCTAEDETLTGAAERMDAFLMPSVPSHHPGHADSPPRRPEVSVQSEAFLWLKAVRQGDRAQSKTAERTEDRTQTCSSFANPDSDNYPEYSTQSSPL